MDDAFGSLSEQIPEIQSEINKSKDTADALSSANETLQSGYQQNLTNANEQFQKNSEDLNAMGSAVNSGITDLQGKKNATASALLKGAKSLKKAGKTLTEGSSQIQEAITQLKKGIQTISANSSALNNGADQLVSSGSQLEQGAGQLFAGSSTLASGTQTLKSGTSALASGVGTLLSGADKLKEASGQVQEGISKLADGAKTLSDGQKKFYKEGVKKLDDAVNKDLKNVIDRFRALKSEAVSYDSFTQRAEDMDGSVKFIYETEAIEVSEEE